MKVHLYEPMFGEKERVVLEHPAFTASTFRYDSGVAALRLTNGRGEIKMLPFQGQQIWSAYFDNRELTMKSMFDEPRQTQDYLETYGGFLIHCGVSAMGVPGEKDTHPLHGELPNAPYQQAYLVLGEDERGQYLGLGGRYQHTVAFSTNYMAEPLVKLHADSSLISTSLTVTNLKATPMELMYLAHINFRPVDHAQLLYSAKKDPEHVRVRKSIPSHVKPEPGYAEFLDELSQQPEKHHGLEPDLTFDPEVVFFIDYLADENGWAHTLQVHPNGAADYVRHRPEQLDVGVRWICRTPDQDALGMVDPATAEPEGYGAEKAKGNVKTVPPGGMWRCDYEMGTLTSEDAQEVERRIGEVTYGAKHAQL